ncbi:MAG: TonB-dependent receptor [Candidatus Polarisedimenticolia bacterium]
MSIQAARVIRVLMFSFSLVTYLAAQPAVLHAAEGSVLTGKVIAQHSQQPIVGATVELVELRRKTRTNPDGVYKFEGLAAGSYTLTVTAAGYAEQTKQVQLPGEELAFTLDLHFHDEPVVVTTSAEPRDPMRVYQPTEVLDGELLEQRSTASLGTTLQYEPGVSTTSMSQASARPVIRGLGGNRVLILEDGTRTGDVSFLSEDHAVAANPMQADSIEIVRGAANLLYGSNAMGGVVNVLSSDIPTTLYDRPTGGVTMGGASNTQELTGGIDFEASTGPISYRVGGWRTDADEYSFHGGTAGNSQADFTGFNGGLSWVNPNGYVGVSYKDQEGDYGIPINEEREPIGRGEKGVTIRLDEKSYKLRGEVTRDFGIFTGARIQAVRHDYTHTEFEETGEPGTIFDQETTELRGDLTHRSVGRFSGTFGVWLLDSDFNAVGEEALLPFAETKGYAAFFYEEVDLNTVRLQFGGRFDDQRVDTGSAGDDRTFTGGSGAFGLIFHPAGKWNVVANVTHNFKAPSAEELFANGPHIATFTFEEGDPELDEETSLGADLGYRWKVARFSGEVTVYRTDFQDFIFLQPVIDPNTGLQVIEDGLPKSAYVQADATFYGAEAHADLALLEHLKLELMADKVVAEEDDSGEPLPRIPPMRAGLGLHWDTDRYGVGTEARFSDEQNRVAPGELPTGDFVVYNVFGHVTFVSGPVVHRLSLRVSNLTDRLYRNHVNLVKDILPEPGRTARLLYTLLY